MKIKKVLIIGGTGYIGSRLFDVLSYSQNYLVDTLDLEWYGNVVNPHNIIMDYRHLTTEQLSKYNVIVLLAAHSSVPMANNSDPQSTFNNNVRNFVDLLRKLKNGQKFIYAGSASVYNGIPDVATEEYDLLTPSNIYDLSKRDLDSWIRIFPDVEFYGLRLGTVNGSSVHTRTDIMMNNMVEAASASNHITLYNEHIRRSILWIADLVDAIKAIIDCDDDRRGIYNLCSFNATAGEIAETTSDILNVELRRVSQSDFEQTINTKLPTVYDFAMNTEKFENTFNFKFNGSIPNIIGDLTANIDYVRKTKRLVGKQYE